MSGGTGGLPIGEETPYGDDGPGAGGSDTSNFIGSDDIPGMLEQLGVAVVLGAYSTRGLLRQLGSEILDAESGAELVGVLSTVLVKTGSLGTGALEGSSVTVAGTSYKIRAALPVEDGACTRLLLVDPV